MKGTTRIGAVPDGVHGIQCAAYRCLGNGERNDLDSGEHVAFLNRLKGRHGRYRDRFVDQVEGIQPVAVNDGDSARRGEDVAPPGKHAAHAGVVAAQNLGGGACGLVFVDVARLQPRGDDFAVARLPQGRDVVAIQPVAFLEHPPIQAHGMGQKRAFCLVEWCFTKTHGLSPSVPDRCRCLGEPTRRDHFRDNGNGNFGWCPGADVEAHGGMNTLDRRFVEAGV